MGTPYVGEIRIFAGNFAPAGWLFCAGQLLPISENETLFQLIGTTYGGDGQETFALPDLRGRIPVHQGQGAGLQNYVLAQQTGVEQVTVTTNQMPVHTHALLASQTIGGSAIAQNNVLAKSTAVKLYIQDTPTTPLVASMLGPQGGSQPHSNFQPYLCLNFIISLFGIYPSPT